MAKQRDAFHDACNWLSYNRWLACGLIVGLFAAVAVVGCQPKTYSIKDPARKVTRQQLQMELVEIERDLNGKKADLATSKAKVEELVVKYNDEVAAVQKAAEAREADLQQQEKVRAQMLDIAGGLVTTIASGGTLTPSTAAGAVVQILTLSLLGGSVLNSRRKDKVIAQTKTAASAGGGGGSG